MAVLVIEKGKRKGNRFEVPDDSQPTVLGRDEGADVPLDDERASRQHASIRRHRGLWVLEDMGSRNGILHKGGAIRKLVLSDGEIFQIGATVLVFRESERIDPLSGMEIQGARLHRLLREEAGVLTYKAQQLAMDRPVRMDVIHPRWQIIPSPPDSGSPRTADLTPFLPALRKAAGAALESQQPRIHPLLRSELPDESGTGFVMLRWTDLPSLEDSLPEVLQRPVAERIRFFARLAGAMLQRSEGALGTPLGLRHILLDPAEGPVIQALELPALLAVLRGCAADFAAYAPYLPPEFQAAGMEPTEAAAIYNLGALGYHIASRLAPMGSGSTAEILDRHRSLLPAPADLSCPEVPPALGSLLSHMMEKDPAARPTGREVLETLGEAGTIQAAPRRAAAAAPAAPAPRGSPQKAPGPGTGGQRSPRSAAGGSLRPPSAAAAPRQGSPQAGTALGSPPGRGAPFLFHMIFWPALWAGLFFGGRWLIKMLLEKQG